MKKVMLDVLDVEVDLDHFGKGTKAMMESSENDNGFESSGSEWEDHDGQPFTPFIQFGDGEDYLDNLDEEDYEIEGGNSTNNDDEEEECDTHSIRSDGLVWIGHKRPINSLPERSKSTSDLNILDVDYGNIHKWRHFGRGDACSEYSATTTNVYSNEEETGSQNGDDDEFEIATTVSEDNRLYYQNFIFDDFPNRRHASMSSLTNDQISKFGIYDWRSDLAMDGFNLMNFSNEIPRSFSTSNLDKYLPEEYFIFDDEGTIIKNDYTSPEVSNDKSGKLRRKHKAKRMTSLP